jgi:hypothetical protein
MPHFVPLYYIDSYIWFSSEQEIVRNNSFPPDLILSQINFFEKVFLYVKERFVLEW